jgi:DNA-binding NtrC family response regulator
VDAAKDLTGHPARLVAAEASPPPSDTEETSFELRDGAGGLLRLVVSASLDEGVRTELAILTTTASLALELSQRAATGRESGIAPAEDEIADGPFVAASQVMRKLRDELGRLSASKATVIVTGESGTGKEVIAKTLVALSRRRDKPYVVFNCAAVPRDLFEGQLFGYRKGAFTGAVHDHAGVIRAADGGTLFLDEIGELPLDVQPKLLRFLENGEVLPLGGQKPVAVDVRIVTATHRDLGALVQAGAFREDLYYRLQVVPIHLPPLRERRDDVVPLALHFLREMSHGKRPPLLSSEARARLTGHSWPGNVRELRNVLDRTLAFEPVPEVLRAQDLRF